MHRFVDKLTKFRRLSPQERRTFLAAMAWLPCFSLALRMFGLRRFRAILHRTVVPAQRLPDSLEQVLRMGELVNIAGRHTPCPVTCLTRSLLLEWLLGRRGVDAELRIGVRLYGTALDAHAWVEYAGMPVNDQPDVASRFVPFGALPVDSALRFR